MITFFKNIISRKIILSETESVNDEMVKHFHERTNFHIDLVKKYLDKIIALKDHRLNVDVLEIEKDHDRSKFEIPEYQPYLHVNWKYKLKGEGKEYTPPQAIQDGMNEATFHHITTNKHHPDYWDDRITIDNLNTKDRDKLPDKMVNATNMPLTYVAVMVADWLAMSMEKKTDPYEWAANNINQRWKFTVEQTNLIYDLLDTLWGQFTVPYRFDLVR